MTVHTTAPVAAASIIGTTARIKSPDTLEIVWGCTVTLNPVSPLFLGGELQE